MANLMRTANPTLNDATFQGMLRAKGDTTVMTLNGTVNKCLALLLLAFLSAIYSWNHSMADEVAGGTLIAGGSIGGLIAAIVTIWRKHWSQYTAVIYAVLEGLALGAISAAFEFKYPGIAAQAVGLTLGTLFCLLIAYKTGFIKPTENLKLGVVAATGAIFVVYLVGFLLSLFGIQSLSIDQTGWLAIGISGFVVVVAALNLVLDFDFIEQGLAEGAPQYMEWYAAFGLLVTLVWLYIEMLRLLARLAGRK
jgi:uncharacterized YccA/Bax inhibitor family protein